MDLLIMDADRKLTASFDCRVWKLEIGLEVPKCRFMIASENRWSRLM